MSTAMLELQSVSKTYVKQQILDSISLIVSEGSFYALLGKNGSGKSTLMRLFSQMETFNSGDILYKGQSLKSMSLGLNEDLVFVSEDLVLPTHQSLEKWAEVFASLSPRYDQNIWKKLSSELSLDTSKHFYQLSRGQKMKAWLALQAPKRPQLYILDEITSVLDSGSRVSLMQYLKDEAARGATVIMSTNIASELQGFASHVGVLDQQKLVFHCAVTDLEKHFTKLRDTETASKSAFAKAVHLNSDNTWSYLIENKHLTSSTTPLDRRKITLQDVAAYYSLVTPQ